MPKAKKTTLPDGWTLGLENNQYYAKHIASGFRTKPCEEQSEAIALAVLHNDGANKSVNQTVGKPASKAETNTVQLIPIGKIQPSPDNPRKHFDEEGMAELTASVREKGVEIPIAVLPAGALGMHTIIYGERRFRASVAAGKQTVPALVLDIDEDRANELRLNENLQRKNLTPLEEADAFHLRITKYGKTIADLAAQTGMSAKTITRRLTLRDLPADAKVALENGKLLLGCALQLARIPSEKLRIEATKAFLADEDYATDERYARQYLEQKFFTILSNAPFKTTDMMLVAHAGACTACTKRTGANGELFADIKGKDTCLDRECFQEKCDAHRANVLAAAEAKGQKILTEKEVEKIAPYGYLNSDGAYARLDDRPRQDDKDRTYQKLLGKDAPEPVIAVIKGEVVKLIPKAEAAPIIKEKFNIDILPTKSSGSSSSSAADEKRIQKARRVAITETLAAVKTHVMATMRGKIDEKQLPFWRSLVSMAIHNMHNQATTLLAKHFDLEPKKTQWGGNDYGAALREYAQNIPGVVAVAAFVVQTIVMERLEWWPTSDASEKPGQDHSDLCAAIGFDLSASLKQALADLKPKKAKGAKA